MAVIRDDVIVAPSVDTITLTEADSVTIEPGIYKINEARTINGFVSSSWNVICLSTNSGTNPVCYTQIWVPAVPAEPITMYIRSRNGPGTGYTGYTTLSNQANSVVNATSYPIELYVQNTAPTTSAGKNIIWIDTSV